MNLKKEEHTSITHICNFLYTNAFFRPVKSTPKKCVNSRQKLLRDKTAYLVVVFDVLIGILGVLVVVIGVLVDVLGV